MSTQRIATQTAILVAAVIGEMGSFALPLMVGTLAESYGVAPGAVGFMISAQIAMFSLATLGLAPRVHQLDRRWLALIGCALIILGNSGSAFAPGFAALVALRALTGLGEGVLIAMMTAAVAEAKSPESIFAHAWILVVIMSIVIAITLPLALTSGGAQTTFLAMAVSVALLTPLIFAFPARMTQPAAPLPAISLRSGATIKIGLATALFAISVNGAWAFIERIGHEHGLSLSEVGYAILVASLIAIGGPILAMILKARWGRALPIAAMLALSSIGVMMTTHAAGSNGFVAGLSLSSFCLVFGMPYLLGLASALDPAGRVATTVRAFGAFGNTITPGLSGALLLAGFGYGALGVMSVICTVGAALLVLPVAMRNDRMAESSAGIKMDVAPAKANGDLLSEDV